MRSRDVPFLTNHADAAPPGPRTVEHRRAITDQRPPRAESADPLETLYRDRWAPMVRLAHLLTGNNAAAQDLVHDAFIKVAARLTDTSRPVDSPQGYLRTAVVNQCMSWHRRKAVEARHATIPMEPIVLGPELDDTWDALTGLPPKRRTALVLRFYEDLSYADIATVMGVRPGTVRSLIHRGLASLRSELTHD